MPQKRISPTWRTDFIALDTINSIVFRLTAEKLWRIAAACSVLLLAISYVGLGIMFEQCSYR
jgi:hypothetical protein